MRTLTFDQFEFDSPDNEESLEISIAAKGAKPFPDIAAFASSVLGIEVAAKLPPPVEFDEGMGHGRIREYLQRHAGVCLPTPCRWPTRVTSNEWNHWDALLEGPSVFVRYHWSTTA